MGYDKQWKIGFGFVMESNGTESDKSDVNDTDADDADIRPIYDKEPMAEVGLTSILTKSKFKSLMLDSSPDNQTTEYSKQSLESENTLLKKNVAQFQKDFSRMEAHCKVSVPTIQPEPEELPKVAFCPGNLRFVLEASCVLPTTSKLAFCQVIEDP
ncbi:hypothetical protein Tco_1020098 [Tanacetum coccineum]|uniref:Uncharacterized protein n=1 Tax=Tanacetum coccineum TaxID=301880 RepID=A0ABQ5G0I4_9ASTR